MSVPQPSVEAKIPIRWMSVTNRTEESDYTCICSIVSEEKYEPLRRDRYINDSNNYGSQLQSSVTCLLDTRTGVLTIHP